MRLNVVFWSASRTVTKEKRQLANIPQYWALRTIALMWLFLVAINIHAQTPKKILFYGPTYNPNGKAEQLVETSAEFYHVNLGTTRSEVWTPGDPTAAKDWSKKTTADFQAFDAIVFSDIHFDGSEWRQITDSTVWAPAIANVAVWSAAVTGNVLLFGGDPEAHAGTQCAHCGGNAPLPGAQEFIENGIRFAAAAGHGLYLPLSAIDPNALSPVNPTKKCVEHLLSGLGSFTAIAGGGDQPPGGADQVHKIYQTPEFSGTTETELSDWGQSAHSGFTSWPAGFQPLALVSDVTPDRRTPSNLLPPGITGLVHILARGTSLRVFYLTPAYSSHAVSTSDSFTAYFKSGSAGISGKSVSFTVAGVNTTQSGSNNTVADGSASLGYTGGATSGRDTVTATVTDNNITYTATRTVDWINQQQGQSFVTIAYTDPTGTEPATSNGSADTATFTVSRTSSVGSLSVSLAFGGTAIFDSDYSATTVEGGVDTPIQNNSITFADGVAQKVITIKPLFDGIAEPTETVVVTVLPKPSAPITYAVGSPSEATVNIISSTSSDVTIDIVDGLIDESGNNPATLKVHRSTTVGSLTVGLIFSGVASFGDDYFLEGLNPDNTITIQNGFQDAQFIIDAIPDSRFEGSEDVTVTIAPSSDGSYSVGATSFKTVYIADDDTQQIPQTGWKLTDLGTLNGYYGFAGSINTYDAGGGQTRGVVVGYQSNLQIPTYLGRTWDNASYSSRFGVAGWGPDKQNYWTQCLGLNNAATVVGQCGYYLSADGYHQWASYWNTSSSSAIQLPLLYTTELGQNNYAYDINQQDDSTQSGAIIVGAQKYNSTGKIHACMWVPDFTQGNIPPRTYTTVQNLGDVGEGTKNSFAYAINDDGEVVGKSQILGTTVYHAFRSDFINGIPVALGSVNDMGTGTFADSGTSEANDINNFGELVGASHFAGSAGNVYHAAYKAPGTPKNLGWYDLGVLSGGSQSIARGINNNGLIVGDSNGHAFVAPNQGNPGSQPLQDLNSNTYVFNGTTWILATQDGWLLTSAKKINDGNWIVGNGTKGGVGHVFVLTPW